MPSHKAIIQRTKCWVEKTVIGLNFCPFAKRELKHNSIRYAVIETSHSTEIPLMEYCLLTLVDECILLDQNESIETTLLIFAQTFEDFQEFLVLIDLAEALLEKQSYQGIYQLASFHPYYRFAGTKQDAAENYTNRSPYPMLHLIREASIERAVAQYPQPEQIPQRNIATANELGAGTLQEMLEQCKKLDGRD